MTKTGRFIDNWIILNWLLKSILRFIFFLLSLSRSFAWQACLAFAFAAKDKALSMTFKWRARSRRYFGSDQTEPGAFFFFSQECYGFAFVHKYVIEWCGMREQRNCSVEIENCQPSGFFVPKNQGHFSRGTNVTEISPLRLHYSISVAVVRGRVPK